MSTRTEINKGGPQFLQIEIGTKHMIQASLTPAISNNDIRNVKHININTHVKKRGLESNWDIKTPRVPTKRSMIRIDQIDTTKRLDVHNSFVKASKKPQTIHRSRVFPKVQIAIFVTQNINPNDIFLV